MIDNVIIQIYDPCIRAIYTREIRRIDTDACVYASGIYTINLYRQFVTYFRRLI